MRLVTLTLASLALAGLFAFTKPAPVSATPAAVEPASYQIDPVHSNVLFKVMHNQASWFYGRFGELSGTFVVDPDPSKCYLEVEVPTGSVDTRSEKLDGHLRSPDFFDSKQFPAIRFESTRIASDTSGVYRVTGELSLHGVTKTIEMEVEKVGESEGRGGKVVGFHSRFVIDRTDYGMTYGAGGPLGSEVELIVSIEAGQN